MNARIITDRRGATAVEFAMLALPFMWLVIGMLELSIYFASSSLMAEAANVGARMVRTGQTQGVGDPATAFRNAVCDRAAVFIPCNRIQFQVRHISDDNFTSAVNYQAAFDSSGNLRNQGFDDGDQSSVIVVRLAYRYPFMTPLIGSLLADGPNTTKLILNTIVMKNEPYDF